MTTANLSKLTEDAENRRKEAVKAVVERLCKYYRIAEDSKDSSSALLRVISKKDITILVRELMSSSHDMTSNETEELAQAEALEHLIVGDPKEGEAGEPSL